MNIESTLKQAVAEAFVQAFGQAIAPDMVTINITNQEFSGDYTVVVFPLAKVAGKCPQDTADELGKVLQQQVAFIESYAIVKGFLNLRFTDSFWIARLMDRQIAGYKPYPANGKKVLLEYCSPNTNKPLHIGHVRNMLLGHAATEILRAIGYEVIKVSIYNDRSIAICKSMAAYMARGNGATPTTTGIKGDHLVGDYYVLFGKIVEDELRAKYGVPEDINVFKAIGIKREVAEQETTIFHAAKDLLQKWEAGDAATIQLWSTLNGWVYDGYQVTYEVMGMTFDRDYYESETYKLGKDIIEEGIAKKVFYKRPDHAVAIDLTADGLDEKILLRSDGTSLYLTQDLGTAKVRYDEYQMDSMIYVVANEQDYHFKVLKLCLQKLGYAWADGIYHLSYGMVESPTGRFKSREGVTADADDIISEVLRIAEEKTKELGKTDGFTEQEAGVLYQTIGLGALKYFILRVNPYKKMVFDPEGSIDFHGQTGSFIQYTYARIQSIIRKYGADIPTIDLSTALHPTERELMLHIYEYDNTLLASAAKYDPAEIANYVYHLAKLYNKFYGEVKVLAATDERERNLRVALSAMTAQTIKQCMKLLGIDVPEKM